MQETLDFIENHLNDNVRELALKAASHPKVNIPFAMDQIAGYQIALQKLPTFAQTKGIQYPHHLSMEQCSSEQTARYKAEVIKKTESEKKEFADLTSGFGVDFFFISSIFSKSYSIERQGCLCKLQQQNLSLFNRKDTTVINTNAEDYLKQMKPVDWIFLDPARRDEHGGKVVAIQDCEPNVAKWEKLLLEKADFVMIKLSPMLDISLAIRTLENVREVHVVAVQNECKELLFILDKNARSIEDIKIQVINLSKQNNQLFSFTYKEESQAIVSYSEKPLSYLYEPNAALTKAGAYRCIGSRMSLKKLHPNSHLYTSDTLISDFPGRIFEIKGYSGFGKKEIKSLLKDITQANLSTRNFPDSVAELRKRLKLKDGGSTYVFATTLKNGEKTLILCQKAEKNQD